MKKQLFNKFFYLLIIFTVLIYINGLLSNIIVAAIKGGFTLIQNPIISLNYIRNTGAAFSMLKSSTDLLVGIGIAAVILTVFYSLKSLKTLNYKELSCCGILLAGIVGNLYERIMLGFVRDYFQINFIQFPIFNISDIFITVGIIGIISIIIIKKM